MQVMALGDLQLLDLSHNRIEVWGNSQNQQLLIINMLHHCLKVPCSRG
jgi:hypothetical protein